MGLGPEDVIRVASIDQTETKVSAQVSKMRPVGLVITNEGGAICVIRKVFVNGMERQSKRLPLVLAPGERGWTEIGFPDEFTHALKLEIEENTGKKHKEQIPLLGMYTDISYLFGLKV